MAHANAPTVKRCARTRGFTLISFRSRHAKCILCRAGWSGWITPQVAQPCASVTSSRVDDSSAGGPWCCNGQLAHSWHCGEMARQSDTYSQFRASIAESLLQRPVVLRPPGARCETTRLCAGSHRHAELVHYRVRERTCCGPPRTHARSDRAARPPHACLDSPGPALEQSSQV